MTCVRAGMSPMRIGVDAGGTPEMMLAARWHGRGGVRVEEAVVARTGGLGPHVVVEAQGRPSSTRDAARLARKGGRIVICGLLPGDVPLDVLDMVAGENVLIGSVQHEREADLVPTLELLASGAVRPRGADNG